MSSIDYTKLDLSPLEDKNDTENLEKIRIIFKIKFE